MLRPFNEPEPRRERSDRRDDPDDGPRKRQRNSSPPRRDSSGGGSSKVSTHDFDKLHTEGWFRDKHHPEKQATALQARARAQLAAAQLKTAVREGAFPGPALRAPLVGDGAAKKQPRLRVVRIDNVPGVALAHAHAALLAAAASAGKASLPAELVALLASEPQTTERGGEGRLWAAYGSDEASAAGRRTLLDAADRRARRRPRLLRGRRPRDAAEARRGGARPGR